VSRLLPLAALAFSLAFAPAALAVSRPNVDARAYLIVDGRTGEVLAARHAHARMPIASITKLMTVLVALEHARLSDEVTVKSSAAGVGESSVGLQPGERLTVRELVEAALIQSANDAAYALAAGVGDGDLVSFVRQMNTTARKLRLRDTHFVRPDGLDAPDEYSSATDVTRLARILMRKPAVRQIVRRRTETISGGRVLNTWNDLLGTFPGVIGVKTGHTGAAGWCEVAAIRRPGYTVYATILGSPSREQRNADLATLLRWGVSRYRVATVIAKGRTFAVAQTGYGREPVHLVTSERVRRAVRVDRPLVARVVAAAAVSLPVHKGDRLGVVRIFDRKRLIASRPLVAARTVERPGLGGRVGFYARRAAEHVWGWVT
jgi:serine-type D-Ala-D-Ala carboxypeptidase (penicillin-binding protein 5/6)